MENFLPKFDPKAKNELSRFWGGKQIRRYYDTMVRGSRMSTTELLSMQRSIAQFVRIGTNGKIPAENVTFRTTGDSYIDYDNKVYVRFHKNPDVMVGVCLHEATHAYASNMNIFKALSDAARDGDLLGHYSGGFFPTLDGLIYKLAGKICVNKAQAIGYAFDLLNWIEDRRIDSLRVKIAPGYRGYYDAVYTEYLYDKHTEELLTGDSFREPSYESYWFRIASFMHPASDLDALPGLRSIYETIGLHNMLRLGENKSGTMEVVRVVCEVLNIINNNVKKLKSSDEDKMTDSQKGKGKQGDGQKGTGSKSDSKDKNDGDKNDSKDKGDKGDENKSNDPETKNKDENKDNGQGDFLNDLLNDLLNSDDADKAVNKTVDKLLKGDSKDDKVNENPAGSDALNKINKMYGSGSSDPFGNTLVVVDQITKKSVEAMVKSGVVIKKVGKVSDKNVQHAATFNGMYFPDWVKSRVGNTNWYNGTENENINRFVDQGRAKAARLRRKVMILNQESTTKSIRQKSGKINRGMLYSASFNDDIFFTSVDTKVNKVLLHIDLDASTSMRGTKWNKSIEYASMVIYATANIESIDVKVTIRSSYKQLGLPAPALVTLWDSRKNKLSAWRKHVREVDVNSNTPESLLYELQRNVIDKNMGQYDQKYLITVTDGEPFFGSYEGEVAVAHCQNEMKEFAKHGFKVMAYFLATSDDYYDRFMKMYGKSGKYLRLENINKIGDDLKHLLLKK